MADAFCALCGSTKRLRKDGTFACHGWPQCPGTGLTPRAVEIIHAHFYASARRSRKGTKGVVSHGR